MQVEPVINKQHILKHMDNENNLLDSFASGFDIESVDGNGNVGNSSETLTLDEINTLTGRNYKDKETALKALKETYSMVGKVGKIEKEKEELNKKLMDTNIIGDELKQIKDELFYTKNPQYAQYRDTISAMGVNPAEVVEKDSFKKIFTDLSEYEKTKSAKSVLESNPRIGQAKTKLDEAKEMVTKGQYAQSKETAVTAVLEAYEVGP